MLCETNLTQIIHSRSSNEICNSLQTTLFIVKIHPTKHQPEGIQCWMYDKADAD